MPIRILSVGQCSADEFRVSRALRDLDAQFESASTADEALQRLRESTYDLVLVNRMLDGDYTPGIDLITQARNITPAKFMLVSDYEDAQAEAIAHGAAPGFGKSALTEAPTRIREALALLPPSA